MEHPVPPFWCLVGFRGKRSLPGLFCGFKILCKSLAFPVGWKGCAVSEGRREWGSHHYKVFLYAKDPQNVNAPMQRYVDFMRLHNENSEVSLIKLLQL